MQYSDRNGEYVPIVSYALVAASWWREIALGAVLAAVAAGALALLADVVAPEYSASADVAVIDTSTTVSLDDSFQAAENVFLQQRGGSQGYLARRAALLGLIKSGSVAEAVAGSMDWLDAGDPVKLSALLDSVSADLVTIGVVTDRNQSDLLRITLKADSPEKAVLGANAWATQYVTEVNRVFMPVTPAVVASVQLRLEEAEENYLKAQVELEKHLTDKNSERIQRRVDFMREDIARMGDARGAIMAIRIDTQTTQQANEMNRRHDIKRKLETMLGDAISLARHVEIGGEAVVRSTSTAVQLLKFKLYGTTDSRLQIALNNNRQMHGDSASLRDDINSLIAAMRIHLDSINIEIEQHTTYAPAQAMRSFSKADDPQEDDPLDFDLEFSSQSSNQLVDYFSSSRDSYLASVESLEGEIQDFEVQLENIASRTKLLTQRRDLAYSNLETLQSEVVELQLTSAGSQSVVRIGAPAVASESTRPRPIILGAAVGAAMLPLSTLLVFFLNAVGVQPLLRRAGNEHLDKVVTSPNPTPDSI